MRMKSMFGFISIVTLALCLSLPQYVTAASDEEKIVQMMENFDKAINTADLELMSSLFWHSPKYSSFGPPKNLAYLTKGWEGIEEMWKTMFKYPAGTYSSSAHNVQVAMLKDDVAVVTSYSVIIFRPPVVKEETSELLRGTSVVQKIGGKWLIVHDHASRLPIE